MFRFIHGYLPGVWEAQVKAGLVGEDDGIRFCQNLMLKDEMKFNSLAAVGGELYKILSERKCVFYIDRMQGGCYIEDYPYDEELLRTYKEMLGENFWGFQMHEWMSNYRFDVFGKLGELSDDEWKKEQIEEFIYRKYPYPYLNLESMTSEEMADAGKPSGIKEFYRNITEIYKKRQKFGQLIPCDSGFLAYPFEISAGAKRLMPEVGAQTPNARIQICYARGMTRKDGRSFGIYYEPWGGKPFSACCYHEDKKNEWGIGDSSDFPFETQGPNGGSSRSLQKRIFLYAYLCGAEFISEEWGLCNTFYDWKSFELSPYGEVKKEFLSFIRKFTDIGDKITQMAVVLPNDLMVLDNLDNDCMYCGFEVHSEKLAKIKQGLRDIFASSYPMLGNEQDTLKNSDIPDAIDILTEKDGDTGRYSHLIDLTFDKSFAERHENLCEIEDIKAVLQKALPCYVRGNAHWLLNECKSGGYYLTLFNHSGIDRTVEKGETQLPDAETTVTLELKRPLIPDLVCGNGVLRCDNGVYKVAIPAGGWAFIKIN
ncbi:MAG: hypothetical protein E7551_09440 [Ruminococcaceae bacterium]|nr:hypothetical protein [Oscillospiraceae bacterium]